MTNDIEEIDYAALRRWRLVIRGAVVAVWVLGVVLAISSGWDPGPWWHSDRPWPYPLGAVLVEIAKITLISLALSMPSNNTTVGRRPLPAPRTK